MAFQLVIVQFDILLHKESQVHHAENHHVIREGNVRPILLTQDTKCEAGGMYFHTMKAGSFAYQTPEEKLACRKHFNLHYPRIEQLQRKYLGVSQYRNVQISLA